MFLGTHYPKLDEKGRLFLPAKYREKLTDGLVITKAPDHCLAVYPVAEFARISEALRSAPATSRAARDHQRFLFASAEDPRMDKAGRVTLTPDLRAYAHLDKDCVAIGANTRFEIWDRTAWLEFVEAGEPAFSALESEVIPGLF